MKDRTIQLPKIVKPLTVKEKVYDLLLKKDMTASEITEELKINPRMTREAIEMLKSHISLEKCRCGRTSIYKVK